MLCTNLTEETTQEFMDPNESSRKNTLQVYSSESSNNDNREYFQILERQQQEFSEELLRRTKKMYREGCQAIPRANIDRFRGISPDELRERIRRHDLEDEISVEGNLTDLVDSYHIHGSFPTQETWRRRPDQSQQEIQKPHQHF